LLPKSDQVVDREEGADAAFAAAGLTLTPLLTLEDFKDR
jgi:orotate phosphoribosyltransferase